MGSQTELVNWFVCRATSIIKFDTWTVDVEVICMVALLGDFQPYVVPQITFGDNGKRLTEGYGSFTHGLIKFTKDAHVNGLKLNFHQGLCSRPCSPISPPQTKE